MVILLTMIFTTQMLSVSAAATIYIPTENFSGYSVNATLPTAPANWNSTYVTNNTTRPSDKIANDASAGWNYVSSSGASSTDNTGLFDFDVQSGTARTNPSVLEFNMRATSSSTSFSTAASVIEIGNLMSLRVVNYVLNRSNGTSSTSSTGVRVYDNSATPVAQWFKVKIIIKPNSTTVASSRYDLYVNDALIAENIAPGSGSGNAIAALPSSIKFKANVTNISFREYVLPSATATLSGSSVVGQSITGTYTYSYDGTTAESGTTWQFVKSLSSSFTSKTIVSSGTGTTSTFALNYTIANSDSGYYFRLEVTPRAFDNVQGLLVTSNSIGPITDIYGGIYGTPIEVDNSRAGANTNANVATYVETGTPAWSSTTNVLYWLYYSDVNNKDSRLANAPDATATFKPTIPTAGLYKVEYVNVYLAKGNTVSVVHNGKTDTMVMPYDNATQWVNLGVFDFAATGTANEYIKFTRQSTSGALRVDGVRLTPFTPGANDNRLQTLITDIGTLSTGFDADTTNYQLALPLVQNYQIKCRVGSGATATINGAPLTNDTYVTMSSQETATIVVTANDNSKTYTIQPMIEPLIVDTQNTEKYTENGVWQISSTTGHYGTTQSRFSTDTTAYAIWNPNITLTGSTVINIKVWSLNTKDDGIYEIHHNGNIDYATINYNKAGWMDLGNFTFSGDPNTEFLKSATKLTDTTPAVRADAVMFTKVINEPVVFANKSYKSGGVAIKALQNATGSVTTSLDIVNSSATDVCIIVAKYSKSNNELISIEQIDTRQIVGNYKFQSNEVSVDNDTILKLFVWDGFTGFKPLTNIFKIQ
jgi:hypothetical protein